MKEKIRGIFFKVSQIKQRYIAVFNPFTFMAKSLFFFMLSILIIDDFDLTGYSPSYLLKTIIVYCLVSLGIFLFLQTRSQLVQKLERYASISYLQVIGTTLFFFPLMILSGRREMFAWFTPFIALILMIAWTNRKMFYTSLTQKSWNLHYSNLWQKLVPQWTSASVKKQANSDILMSCDHVLISGAGTILGQKILSLIANDNLKNIVLIESNFHNLEIMKVWTQKFLPKVQVVSILNNKDLTAQNLKSLFKTYNIKYVFDLDRCFQPSALEADPHHFILRNLNFPKLLLDQSIASKVKMVASLSAIPLTKNEILETAQTIIECYGQRLDSHKTRVIPFRIRALAEDHESQVPVMNYLWGYTSDLTFAPAQTTAVTILTIMRQLLENPAHHGAVWEITHAYEMKKIKSQNTITIKDDLNEIHSKLQATLLNAKRKTIASDFMFPTSQDGAAIVANCPILETDFDQCFKDIEESILETARPTKKAASC